MSQEIIEYQDKQIPVYEHQTGQHPRQGSENIAYQVFASLTRAFAFFAVINDPQLGQGVLRFTDLRRLDAALDELIDPLCSQANCAGGAHCVKKKQ